MDYPRLYRVFAELWIYMGLAWLSLFFSWNVHMVVEAHKVFKKRRDKHKHLNDEEVQPIEAKHSPEERTTVIDIFKFLSDQDDDYSTVIKEIGTTAITIKPTDNINRSKSCSDILGTNIRALDHSPRRRRMISISEVFINAAEASVDKGEDKAHPQIQESNGDAERAECARTDNEENKDSCAFDSESGGIVFTVPAAKDTEEESVKQPGGGGTRFIISKVVEEDVPVDTDEKG